MKGKMYIDDFLSEEYILVDELDAIVALMEPVTQRIVWVTRNTLQSHYTLKQSSPKTNGDLVGGAK